MCSEPKGAMVTHPVPIILRSHLIGHLLQGKTLCVVGDQSVFLVQIGPIGVTVTWETGVGGGGGGEGLLVVVIETQLTTRETEFPFGYVSYYAPPIHHLPIVHW